MTVVMPYLKDGDWVRVVLEGPVSDVDNVMGSFEIGLTGRNWIGAKAEHTVSIEKTSQPVKVGDDLTAGQFGSWVPENGTVIVDLNDNEALYWDGNTERWASTVVAGDISHNPLVAINQGAGFKVIYLP